jgi:ankyrin repeat protein
LDDQAPNLTAKIWKTPCDLPGVFRALVDAKADISARGQRGATPLVVAAAKGNVEAVNTLLSLSANPNDVIDNNQTALHVASQNGCLGAVSALIAAGADVDRADDGDSRPITMAVLNNHLRVVSTLIAAGADVNHVYKAENMTLLDIAMAQSSDMSILLRKAGAKMRLQLMVEASELSRAVSRGDVKLVNKLVRSAGEKEKNAALTVAVYGNMLPMVKCLLAAGVNPSIRDAGSSLLTDACIGGFTEIVRELIHAGADMTLKDEDGMTALQHAAKHKHRDVVALLLAKAKELKNKNK